MRFSENNVFEYHIRTKFNGDNPIEVVRFIRKLVHTFNRLEVTEMDYYVKLPFFFADRALHQSDFASRSGDTAMFGVNK